LYWGLTDPEPLTSGPGVHISRPCGQTWPGHWPGHAWLAGQWSASAAREGREDRWRERRLTLRSPARPAGQGSLEDGESGGGEREHLQGRWAWRQRLQAPAANSFCEGSQDDEAEHQGITEEHGAAWYGGTSRRSELGFAGTLQGGEKQRGRERDRKEEDEGEGERAAGGLSPRRRRLAAAVITSQGSMVVTATGSCLSA
jgi:hypothetical protein